MSSTSVLSTTASLPTQDAHRRQLVMASDLNGIDYAEVDAGSRPALRVYFLKPVPPDVYGLRGQLDRIKISGGTRIPRLTALSVTRTRPGRGDPEPPHLHVVLDRTGDHSEYTLEIDHERLDPCFRTTSFSFTADQAVDLDCEVPPSAPPPSPEPLLDYLAKDYSSFRQALLELLPQLNPDYIERSPADLGITLIELLAYAGDQLSYLQDAVANEAYLDTLRLRVSARRHARLLDYRMHDGRNAWTWVQLTVPVAGQLPQGTPLLTQVQSPLSPMDSAPPPTVIDDRPFASQSPATLRSPAVTAAGLETNAALASVAVFETTHPALLDPLKNQIRIHDWGVPGAVLPAGSRIAHLYAIDAGVAVLPALASGDFLLLQQVADVVTGLVADADPALRQVVVLEGVPEPTHDAVFAAQMSSGAPRPRRRGEPPLPLLKVTWRAQDALAFPLALSPAEGTVFAAPGPQGPPYAAAGGNVVLADHGLTTVEQLGADLRLQYGPLTMEAPPALAPGTEATYLPDPTTGAVLAMDPRRDVSADVHAAAPAVAMQAGGEIWRAAPDLLESSPFDRRFVAEVDDSGFTTLRFGDGEYGREFDPRFLEPGADPADRAVVTYRVGNGTRGEVGADSIRHVVVNTLVPGAAWLAGLEPPPVVTNPLPAVGGVDPELIAEVRSRAPQAALTQVRAVTEDDYRLAVLSVPGVAQAAAAIRWTGSWHTAFVGVEPASVDDLERLRDGTQVLKAQLAADIDAVLSAWRLAGCDVELGAPDYVPLLVELQVTVAEGHFRSDVRQAVTDALSSRLLPDGSVGFFHHSRLQFGKPVFLSQVVAAADAVPGVDLVQPVAFHPLGQADTGQLAAGVIPISTFQIARLDGDPRNPDLGVLRVSVQGGK